MFDTYPDRARLQEVKVARDTDIEGKDIKVLAKVICTSYLKTLQRLRINLSHN